MVRTIRSFFACLVLIAAAIQGVGVRADLPQTVATTQPAAQLDGSWRVKFRFSGDVERNLIFDSKAKGSGSFRLLDTGPNDKPVADPLPAVWSQLTNDRVSFSGEAEVPMGTCCREVGTITFKGKFDSSNSISGKIVFVTSVNEEESPYKLRSVVGTFTATRIINASPSGPAVKN